MLAEHNGVFTQPDTVTVKLSSVQIFLGLSIGLCQCNMSYKVLICRLFSISLVCFLQI